MCGTLLLWGPGQPQFYLFDLHNTFLSRRTAKAFYWTLVPAGFNARVQVPPEKFFV
jgi:hypothetical protein